MSTEGPVIQSGDINDNDRLMAALSYPIPIVGIIILLVESMKIRPYQKYHGVQSLAINVVLWIIILITSPFTCGITALLWLITLYWAYKAYKGEYFEIPVITKFIKDKNWV